MYRIETMQGDLVANIPRLNYVKRDGNNFVPTSSLTAEAITLNGQIYNVAGYPSVGDFVTVNVLEYDDTKTINHKYFDLWFCKRGDYVCL